MSGHEAERIVIYFAVHLLPALGKQSPVLGWMPPNGSLHGFLLDHLLRINLLLICGFFLLAQFLMVLPLFQRRGSKPRHDRRMVAVEILSLAVLSAVFIWMTVTSQRLWANSRFTGASPAAMQVEVVGVQFQWYFRYPGGDETFGKVKPELVDAAGGNPLGIDGTDPDGKDDVVSSELVLPMDREVDLRLRSQDVIHGFFIPGMRLKQDAIPGMVLHIHFTPTREGQYPILCSQLCGLGHARMQARLRVLPRSEFVDWLNQREKARMLEGPLQ